MNRGSSQARFSSDLSTRTGHEAIVAHCENEIKFLEHMKDFMVKRAKVESDYATALSKLLLSASKFHIPNDYESPIKKAWKSYREENEAKAKLVTQLAGTINTSTVKRLEQLTEGKRTLLKKYKTGRFKVDSEFKQEAGEIDRLTKTYRDNAKDTENAKGKYEDALAKKGKESEKSRDRYMKLSLKLHQNHNDYVLALMSANCHQEFYSNTIVPKMLDSLQELQEEYAKGWKDIMQEAFDSTNCCSEEFLASSRNVQEHIDSIRSDEEYVGFVTASRKTKDPVDAFKFESALLELTTADFNAHELNVNDLTYEKLQHKRTLLSQQLDAVKGDIQSKRDAAHIAQGELEKGEQEQKDPLSVVQMRLNVSVETWQLDELLCSETKLQKMTRSIGSALDQLGNSPPPKFADFPYQGIPSSPGDLGHATPELRRSAKRISTLFGKKRKAQPPPPTTTSPPASSAPINAAANTDNADGDSIDSDLGEYLEPPEEEVPLHEAEWFHGTIERKEVENLLKKDGDCLVRESRTQPGQYVLSTRTQGQMRHFIIQSAEGLVKFEDASFPSVHELLKHHIDNQIPVTKKSQAILVTPVLRPAKDKWELKHCNIQLGKKLGQGHFGDVMRGSLKPSNMDVAVKLCKESVSEIAKQKFLAEADILKQYQHPNIVKLIGVCADEEPVYIVMELMPGGDFLSYLRKSGDKLKTAKLLKFSIHAASGMEYLESKNCIHRDLAARNCLIGKTDILKISDFGMSREVEEGLYEASNMKEIPVKWTAPEALNFAQYTTSSDIWSFGVLLWETFSFGNTPYPGFTNRDTREKVETGYRMPPPSGTPPAIYTLMKDCWHRDAEQRPRFTEILRRLKQVQVVTS